MKRLLAIGLIFLLLFCSKTETTPEPKDAVDLLPIDNEISGWNRSSATKIAENETQLFDLIDGEGQVYIDNGFVKCAFQNYVGELSGTTVDLELRIFDMGDTANAKKVYDVVAVGTETPWTDDFPGVEARIEEGLFTAYKIDFWQDKFYVWITIQDKTEPGLSIAKVFAFNISDGIADE